MVDRLIGHRDLLIAWTMRIIRARYQQSLLGGLWAIFQPAATVAILSVIFTYVIPVDTQGVPYVVFSYSAMVPWFLFSSSITDMVESIVSNMNLVSKIYFPREILVVSALLARLLDFGISFILLILLIYLYKMPLYPQGVIYLPIILLIELLLALGLGFAGAALNVFVRDVKHLVILGLQLWFYATPIIYPTTLLPPKLQQLIKLNPMTGVIQGFRSILIYKSLPDSTLLISALISLLIFAIGYIFFKRAENKFADVI